MNIRKKVGAIAGSAVLLAGIFSVAVAPAALASAVCWLRRHRAGRWHVDGHRNLHVPGEQRGELLQPGWQLAGPDVRIRDSANNNNVSFSGTPVVTAPGSLGATAVIAGGNNNQLSDQLRGV